MDRSSSSILIKLTLWYQYFFNIDTETSRVLNSYVELYFVVLMYSIVEIFMSMTSWLLRSRTKQPATCGGDASDEYWCDMAAINIVSVTLTAAEWYTTAVYKWSITHSESLLNASVLIWFKNCHWIHCFNHFWYKSYLIASELVMK